MRFIKNLWLVKFTLIMIFFLFFICGYFVTDLLYNSFTASYEYVFRCDDDCTFLLSENFYINSFNKLDELNISYSNINYKDMLLSADLYNDNNTYHFIISKRYFPNMVSMKTGVANSGNLRVERYFNLLLEYSEFQTEFVEVNLINNVDPFIVGVISGVSVLFIFIIILLIYSLYLKKELSTNRIKQNTIFSKAYWKGAIGFGKNVKNICIISVLFSCMIICKMLPIPSGFGSLGISLTYLFFSLIALIYGPICGIFIGFCSDIIGHFMNSSGVFFFGYTINSLLAGFVYGLCFYKKRITFVNCFIARTTVNLLINALLGSLWWKLLYNSDFEAFITYISLTALPKNIIYLIPQSIFLYIFFRFAIKPLAIFGLIDNQIGENVKLF